LTGKIPEDFRNKVKDEIENFFQPVLQQKINLSELALVGEAKDGNFYVIRQMPLALKT
ncbi:MAG: phosphonate metabolism protein, partial [Rhodobacterales bacterium]|nr:phosphonate metabolism protein [Rhodobacterales bacterium]